MSRSLVYAVAALGLSGGACVAVALVYGYAPADLVRTLPQAAPAALVGVVGTLGCAWLIARGRRRSAAGGLLATAALVLTGAIVLYGPRTGDGIPLTAAEKAPLEADPSGDERFLTHPLLGFRIPAPEADLKPSPTVGAQVFPETERSREVWVWHHHSDRRIVICVLRQPPLPLADTALRQDVEALWDRFATRARAGGGQPRLTSQADDQVEGSLGGDWHLVVRGRRLDHGGSHYHVLLLAFGRDLDQARRYFAGWPADPP